MPSARERVRKVLQRRTMLHTDSLIRESGASLRLLHLMREEGQLVTIGRRRGRSNTNLWCLADCTDEILADVEAANAAAHTTL